MIKNDYKSPNYNKRPQNTVIDTLVIHYTGMKSAREALERLCDSEFQVSSHYVIDEDGSVYGLVDENMRAWHAGKSYWRGRENVNDFSVGIELVNPGHEWGYRPYTELQMQSLGELCKDILKRNPAVEWRNIIGHSDIAPERKEDPGELFDWYKLYEVLGFTLEVFGNEVISVKAHEERVGGRRTNIQPSATIHEIQQYLSAYGYKIDRTGIYNEQTRKVVIAFQRHFIQHKLDGIWGEEEERVMKLLL